MASNIDGMIEKRKFTPSFIKSLLINFAEMKPGKSDKDRIEEAIMAKDGGLSSLKKAISTAYPDMSDEQIEEEIKQIDKEKNISLDGFEISPPNPAEQGQDDVENS